LLAALAVVAIFGVARRLWPARLDAALLSALLVATSLQVLVTSMTSYAMTAHLTLNLIWLWLFDR
jgi:membrane associated rhomboid family serine protease